MRILNNQPTPSNWDLEPVVMKRSRSHRLTILSFFCLFCISQQLLDINLFILTCPKLLERGWPLSGGWLTQSFDQMKCYRECGAKTNNSLVRWEPSRECEAWGENLLWGLLQTLHFAQRLCSLAPIQFSFPVIKQINQDMCVRVNSNLCEMSCKKWVKEKTKAEAKYKRENSCVD